MKKQMYFIKYHPLKEQLRDRTLCDREALPYYLLFLVSSISFAAFPMNKPMNEWGILSGIAEVVLTIIGTIFCYARNGGHAGHDFIQKAVVLGWIVAFRVCLAWIPIFVVAGIVKDSVYGDAHTPAWYDFVLLVVFLVLYFQRLGKHLADINDLQTKPCTTSEQPADGSPGRKSLTPVLNHQKLL